MRKKQGADEQEMETWPVNRTGPTYRYDPVSEDDSLTMPVAEEESQQIVMQLVAHAMLVMAGSWA